MKQKKAICTVTNDIATDNRVLKSASVLAELGFSVTIFGRLRKKSLTIHSLPFNCIRKKLLFNSGPLFYAEFNLRLFFYLLFHRVDLVYANDLDTLLPAVLVNKLKGTHLIYDTHEYFTGVPELENNAFAKRTWERIEKFAFPKLKTIITVNESIANLYSQKYGKPLFVVRNVPRYFVPAPTQRAFLGLPMPPTKLLILQGSGINVDRGSEEMVEAMQFLQQVVLLIVGGGDVIPQLKKKVEALKLEEKVIFIERQPYDKLMQYTVSADLGISLDKDTNINYRFSLPNKLFDYIQAGIPVYASDLPEIRKIVDSFSVGMISSSHQPKIIATEIQEMLNNEIMMNQFKMNGKQASNELCWEKEKETLIEALRPYCN